MIFTIISSFCLGTTVVGTHNRADKEWLLVSLLAFNHIGLTGYFENHKPRKLQGLGPPELCRHSPFFCTHVCTTRRCTLLLFLCSDLRIVGGRLQSTLLLDAGLAALRQLPMVSWS